jgi:hypothetical protein
MKIFSAEPTRVLSFAPGRDHVVLSRGSKMSRSAEPAETLRTNDLKRAPIKRFDARFIETMRVKGG